MLNKQNTCIYLRYFSKVSLLFLILLQGFTGISQELNFDQRLSVSYSNVPLEKVLDDLTQRTGIQFSYNPEAINSNQKISYKANNLNVSEILDQVLSEIAIDYELVGGYLILKEAQPEHNNQDEPMVKKYTISGFIYDSKNNEALIGAAVYNPETGLGALTNN